LFLSQSAFEIITEIFYYFCLDNSSLSTFFYCHRVLCFLYSREKNQDWKYVVLAIDIPQINTQTPKAVEQIFSNLSGAFFKPDLLGKFKDGYRQKYFSFEIVSIEGYIQFLIRTPSRYNDLVKICYLMLNILMRN